jgi:tetratricopeptide (TPR) repeat protein
MGGVGKTQLALAYAQRHRKDYQLGWWIPAETQLGIITALADLAAVLGLRTEQTPVALAAQVRDALAARSGWLLIFDNAPDPTVVAEFLPVAGGGHVLVTSRNSAWQGIAEPVPVDLLTLDEAMQLLVRRSGDSDRQAAARLAEALDRLPLALEQASAYVAQQHLTLAAYLELFDQRRAELLARGTPLAYQGTVDATFSLIVQQLRQRNPAAVQLLEFCALLAPDELPIEVLLSQPQRLSEPLATAARDPLGRREVEGALFAAGLLTRDAGETARIHRLIRIVIQDNLLESDRERYISDAIELMAELFPLGGDEPDSWPQSAQLLPHAQTLIDHPLSAQANTRGLANLLMSVGDYLHGRGLDWLLARQMHEQAVAIYQQLDEHDSFDVASGLTHLARDLNRLGEHEGARELNQQALVMYKRIYEGDHHSVAQTLINLAADLTAFGEHERARELDEQALAMRQRLYQGDHPEVAMSLNNLAFDLRGTDELERARELDEQAVAMRQRLEQGDHPLTASSLNNLADDLRALGEYERAREPDEQALAMRQRLYQGDHPDVAMSLNNLADDLPALGDYERARELDRQALAMQQLLLDLS